MSRVVVVRKPVGSTTILCIWTATAVGVECLDDHHATAMLHSSKCKMGPATVQCHQHVSLLLTECAGHQHTCVSVEGDTDCRSSRMGNVH